MDETSFGELKKEKLCTIMTFKGLVVLTNVF